MQQKNRAPSPIFYFYFIFIIYMYRYRPLLEMINYRIAFEIFKEPVVFRDSCYLSSFFFSFPAAADAPYCSCSRSCSCYPRPPRAPLALFAPHYIILYAEKEFPPTFTHESRIQSARLRRYETHIVIPSFPTHGNYWCGRHITTRIVLYGRNWL